MFKTLKYGWIVFKYSWEANGFYAILSIVSKLYEATFFPFIQVLLLAKLLDMISKLNQIIVSDIYFLIISFVLASLFKIILTTFLDVKLAYLDAQFEAYVDLKISKKLTELDTATLENPKFQLLLTQIEGIKGTLQAQLIRFMGLISFVFQFITSAIVVSVILPWVVPLLLIATIPSFLAWDRFRVKTWPFYVEKRSHINRITQYIKNLLSQDSTSKEVAIFGMGETLTGKIKTHQNLYFNSFAKVNDPWIYKIIVARIIQFIVFVFIQFINLSSVLKGAVGVGQFTLIFQQTLVLANSSEEILNQYSSISARTKYLDKFIEFLNTEKVIKSISTPIFIPQSPTPAVIEFKNVFFKYPKTDRFILENFNMKISSGEKVALVGENGTGKTTIIKLLLRFYDVTKGEILINNINIKDLKLQEWHKQVGALFQDFIKYQFTFKENVVFGNLNKKDNIELLKEAIKQSGSDQYLDQLPKGIDQMVGKMFDEGIDLSGGQWQKLALARAFFRNAPLLILDEPTSAIDAKAEYEIFKNVQNLQKDKTVIIVSHRFSTVRNADKILVLEGGRVIEEGNHEKLMSKKRLYAELFSLQAEGYK